VRCLGAPGASGDGDRRDHRRGGHLLPLPNAGLTHGWLISLRLASAGRLLIPN
jgi:hypothetical protein